MSKNIVTKPVPINSVECGWSTNVSSIGDVGGNTIDSIMGSELFLKFPSKTCRKLILFKTRKKIQVSGHIHFEYILVYSGS